jgi:exosortase A-associated hydrolase 2
VLWGLRLGSLLACDLVATAAVEPDLLLLWQPATSGRAFFDQFLRIAGVQSVTGGGAARDRKALRAELAAGRSVEIGGYELNPAMVSGAEAVDLAGLRAPGCPVIWRETSSAEPPAMGVASSRVVAGWRASGARIDDSATRGPSFWTTLEIEEAPALVESTCEAVARFLASGAPR